MNIKPSTVYFLKNVVFDCLSCGAFVCCLLSSLYFSFSDGIVSDVVVNQTVLFANHFSMNTMYTKIFAKKSATDNAAEQIRFAKQYVHDDPMLVELEQKIKENNATIKKKTQATFYTLFAGLLMMSALWYLIVIRFSMIGLAVALLKNIGMSLIMAWIEILFLFVSAKRFIPVDPIYIDRLLLPFVQFWYCNELTQYPSLQSQQPPPQVNSPPPPVNSPPPPPSGNSPQPQDSHSSL